MKKLIIALSIIASGCTLSAAEFKQGPDAKQFDRDDYECERDARNIRGTVIEQMRLYERCMLSKGYEKEN
jgi:hypothetical protein